MLLPESGQDSEVGTFLKSFEGELAGLRANCRSMRRRLPTDAASEPLVSYPASTAAKASEALSLLTPLCKGMHMFGRTAAQQAGLQGEASLPPTKLAELLHQAIDKVYEFNEGGVEMFRANMEKACKVVDEINKAYQDGEWDVETIPTRPTPPVVQRAEAYKAEIREAAGLKIKIEKKDSDIKELKLALRARGEELSEMQVRKDKAEKRLLDATREADMAREKLQRKVDDLNVMLKKKEKDFEVTMEHLQADIDQLEGEKGQLKDKIKDITKQTLFKQINEKMAASGAATAASTSATAAGAPISLGSSQSLSGRVRKKINFVTATVICNI